MSAHERVSQSPGSCLHMCVCNMHVCVPQALGQSTTFRTPLASCPLPTSQPLAISFGRRCQKAIPSRPSPAQPRPPTPPSSLDLHRLPRCPAPTASVHRISRDPGISGPCGGGGEEGQGPWAGGWGSWGCRVVTEAREGGESGRWGPGGMEGGGVRSRGQARVSGSGPGGSRQRAWGALGPVRVPGGGEGAGSRPQGHVSGRGVQVQDQARLVGGGADIVRSLAPGGSKVTGWGEGRRGRAPPLPKPPSANQRRARVAPTVRRELGCWFPPRLFPPRLRACAKEAPPLLPRPP